MPFFTYAYRVLIGACNPLLCPITGCRTGGGGSGTAVPVVGVVGTVHPSCDFIDMQSAPYAQCAAATTTATAELGLASHFWPPEFAQFGEAAATAAPGPGPENCSALPGPVCYTPKGSPCKCGGCEPGDVTPPRPLPLPVTSRGHRCLGPAQRHLQLYRRSKDQKHQNYKAYARFSLLAHPLSSLAGFPYPSLSRPLAYRELSASMGFPR